MTHKFRRKELWLQVAVNRELKSIYPSKKYNEEYIQKKGNNEAINSIKKDVFRTFSHLSIFQKDYSNCQNPLFNVLLAYSQVDSEIGYT